MMGLNEFELEILKAIYTLSRTCPVNYNDLYNFLVRKKRMPQTTFYRYIDKMHLKFPKLILLNPVKHARWTTYALTDFGRNLVKDLIEVGKT